MEKACLNSADYWCSDEVDIRLNPKRNYTTQGLAEALRSQEIHSAVVLATSGSTGAAKYIVLPKKSILTSASMVNQHCAIDEKDIWLASLSTFHVGGLGIYARSYLSGSKVSALAWDHWDQTGKKLADACNESGATLTSLTPAHLYDIVEAKMPAPQSLRGVFLGGGSISPSLLQKGKQLGWPLWPSYGMTETCSQVATSRDGDYEWLPILKGIEVTTDPDGLLKFKGNNLLAGQFFRENEKWVFDPAIDESGWYRSNDRGVILNGCLQFLARSGDEVKILGELVSISEIERLLSRFVQKRFAILNRPHPRKDNELVLVLESSSDQDLDLDLPNINQHLSPLEQVSEIVSLDPFPRGESGKVDRGKLRRLTQKES